MEAVGPLVCCVTLDPGGRPDFTARAKHCVDLQHEANFIYGIYNTEGLHDSIGVLRNLANQVPECLQQPDFYAHFDWDDWSAPDRLSIQLAHIQKTGKLVTGFYNMLFYDSVNDRVHYYEHPDHRFALGTSLFYRREAWEKHPFPDMTPEDNRWRRDVGLDNCSSISSLREDGTPIMIQTLHGANASAKVVHDSARWKTPTAEQERMVREIIKNHEYLG